MKTGILGKTLLVMIGAVGIVSGLFAQQAASSDLKDRLIVDARLRLENVDQEWGGDADGLTLRTRLGYESEDFEGFKFLVEGEFSTALRDDFDAYPGAAGTPGKAMVFDGDTVELNRAHFSYTEGDFTTIIGRQRIILDNARFVGNVGWRQNEQTYDAATFVYKPSAESTVFYAYVDRVQRIFGSETPVASQRRLDTKAHVLNYSYKPDENSQFGGYVYDLGVRTTPGASSRTIGGFYQGSAELDNGWKATTRFEIANQTENGTSPVGTDFSLSYLHLLVSASKNAYSTGLGWEVLGGDGRFGFSTPLATLHAFNGWADVFLATPGRGLDDKYAWAGYKFDKDKSAKIVYHKFEAEEGNLGFGDEIDLVFGWKIDDATTFTAKFADYNGKGEALGGLKIDRRKFWLQLEYQY